MKQSILSPVRHMLYIIDHLWHTINCLMSTLVNEIMNLKLALFLLLLTVLDHISTSFAQRQAYVVYLGEHNGKRTPSEIEDTHHSYLSLVKGSKEDAEASLIHSYKKVINGFSALLTPDEAAKLSGSFNFNDILNIASFSFRIEMLERCGILLIRFPKKKSVIYVFTRRNGHKNKKYMV